MSQVTDNLLAKTKKKEPDELLNWLNENVVKQN